jgi:uncharacterized protein (DUF983 family)
MPADDGLDSGRPSPAPRDLRSALRKGLRRRCPNCGAGPVFNGYLHVRKSCQVCRQDFSGARADDGPAYLTILLVGHIAAVAMHIIYFRWQPEPLIFFTILAVGSIGLSLYLLPRLKGAIIGFQWARRMHGFRNDPD